MWLTTFVGSLLTPLVFLIYISDLQFVSGVLDPIIIADDMLQFVIIAPICNKVCPNLY